MGMIDTMAALVLAGSVPVFSNTPDELLPAASRGDSEEVAVDGASPWRYPVVDCSSVFQTSYHATTSSCLHPLVTGMSISRAWY